MMTESEMPKHVVDSYVKIANIACSCVMTAMSMHNCYFMLLRILKFTLKQLQRVSVESPSSGGYNSSLLKLLLLK